MEPFIGNHLGNLFCIQPGRTRTINAENPTGEPGKGGMAASPLGPSRKGSPCLKLPIGSTVTLAEMSGPGVIQHIWITVTDQTDHGLFVLRDLVLRFYWDDEPVPSVEVPLGDFFCCGFATETLVKSQPIVVNPKRGMNSYFPMPFRKQARITVENQHGAEISGFFYQVDYCLYDELPENTVYFHAQWRRQRLTNLKEDYCLLDQVRGHGYYIGTYLALTSLERYWWGEGEMKFFIDGDAQYPTICGTGTEDYFGGAWSFAATRDGQTIEQTFCTPYMGYPFYSHHDKVINPYYNNDCPPMRGFYRWHIPDPIHFSSDLKVTLQQIGVCKERGLFERQDDVASVAYWYQADPHTVFPTLPEPPARWPR